MPVNAITYEISSPYTEDLTVSASTNVMVVGPVVIPNVTINGNLNVIDELDTTGTITIVGNLRII